MSNAALEVLAQRVHTREAPVGTVLVKEGESGNRFYLIASGAALVCKHHQRPNQVDLAILGKGEFFGEMCILETLPRSATVVTTEPGVVYTLSSLDFLHLYDTMPAQYGILLLNLARDLSRRLRHLDELFAALHG